MISVTGQVSVLLTPVVGSECSASTTNRCGKAVFSSWRNNLLESRVTVKFYKLVETHNGGHIFCEECVVKLRKKVIGYHILRVPTIYPISNLHYREKLLLFTRAGHHIWVNHTNYSSQI